MATDGRCKVFNATSAIIVLNDETFGDLLNSKPIFAFTPIIEDGKPVLQIKALQYSTPRNRAPISRWLELPLSKSDPLLANYGKVFVQSTLNPKLKSWQDAGISFDKHDIQDLDTGEMERPDLVFLELHFSHIWEWHRGGRTWRGAEHNDFDDRSTREFLTKVDHIEGTAKCLMVVQASKDRGHLEEFVRLCREGRRRFGWLGRGEFSTTFTAEETAEHFKKIKESEIISPFDSKWLEKKQALRTQQQAEDQTEQPSSELKAPELADKQPGSTLEQSIPVNKEQNLKDYEEACKAGWLEVRPALYPTEAEEVAPKRAHDALREAARYYDERLVAIRKALEKADRLGAETTGAR